MNANIASILECIVVGVDGVVICGLVPIAWYKALSDQSGELTKSFVGSWNHHDELSLFVEWIIGLSASMAIVGIAALALAPRRRRAQITAAAAIVIALLCFAIHMPKID